MKKTIFHFILLPALCCLSFHLGAQTLSCSASFNFQVNQSGVVQFTNTSTSYNTGITSTWDFGDGTSSNDMNPSHQYANPGPYYVCLKITVTTPNGIVCTDTHCDSVLAGQRPCIDPSVIDQNIACATIYDPVCGCDGVTYPNYCEAYNHHGVTSWTPGACPGTGGCQASFTFQTDPLTLAIQFTNTSTGNNNLHFSAFWDFGDNTTSADINPAHTYLNAGTYHVCLTITVPTTAGTVCTDTYCKTITVGTTWPGCQANFTFTIDSSGFGVQFTDNSLVTTATFATYWDFGDNTTSADFNPFHVYQSPGTYTVCLILHAPASGLGCIDTICKTVTVGHNVPCIDPNSINPNCVCPLIYSPVCGCNGVTYDNYCFARCNGVTSWTQGACPNPGCTASFTFTYDQTGLGVQFNNHSTGNTGTAPYTSDWDFGDGTTSTVNSPHHTYAAAGVYLVCLKISVITPNGVVCTDTHCDSVRVGQHHPCVDPSVIDTSIVCVAMGIPGVYCGCDGNSYASPCEAYYYHGVTSGSWSYSGQCPPQGCQASFTYQTDPHSLAVHFSNTSLPNPQPVNFASSWDFGDNTVSGDFNPVHTYQSPGVYYVCLTITVPNAGGSACTSTFCDSVRVGAPCLTPSPLPVQCICPQIYDPVCGCDGVTYSNSCFAQCAGVNYWTPGPCPNQGCQASFQYTPDQHGTGAQFTNTSTGSNSSMPFTSNWNFGDGTSSTDKDPHHTFPQPGTYYVCLTISVATPNGIFCTSTWCDSVKVGTISGCNNLSVTIGPGPCMGPLPSLMASASGGTPPYTYAWNTGTTGSVLCNLQPGTYCVTVTDAAGCMKSACEVVGGTGGCQASFTFQPDPNALSGQFTNTSTPSPGTLYYSHWNFGDGTTSSDLNPHHTFPAAGVYSVCLTITVPLSNGTSCTSTFCDSVRVGHISPCLDPSLINPNVACIQIYDPVCGCDGVTYPNKCVAYYHHGVTSWTNGPCGGTSNCQAKFVWNYGIIPPTIFFTDISTGNNIISWHWDFGDGSTSNQQNPSHNFPHPGTYVVCLTIGCATTPLGPVYLSTWCDTIFHAPGCIDPALIDQSYPCPSVYEPVCGCDNITYYNSCVAKYRYGVTAWTMGPCQNTTQCTANFSFQVTPHTNTVQFTNLSTGPATNWQWDFGDGTTSTDKNPLHNYAQSGRYYVCLKIFGTNLTCYDIFCDSIYIPGCIDVSLISHTTPCPFNYDPVCGCDSVTYYNACIAQKRNGVTSWTPGPCHSNCQANFTVAYPLSGNQILFFDNSTGNYTRLKWDFGDGSFSTDRNPVHLYDVTGWYHVCLTIANPNGSCYSVYCDSVFANGCHDPSLKDPSIACPTIYQPVCGCDGVTYPNACVAMYHHGVAIFTPGACPGSNYCPTQGLDQHRVWIKRVGSNITGDNGGYAYFDFCHRTFQAGRTYTLKVVGVNNGTPNFQAHWRVWLDFNHDNDFDDPGELAWQGFGSLNQFAVVTIPNYACTGCTRMRVTLSNDFVDACGDYAVGETEDYDITIRSNVLCTPHVLPPFEQFNPYSLKGEASELDEEFMEEYVPVSITLYPNPAQDEVNVQLSLAEESQQVTVKVLDIRGREIFVQQIKSISGNTTLQIPTSDLANGIYQVVAQTDKGFKETQKLVVAR